MLSDNSAFSPPCRAFDVSRLIAGVLAGDRVALGRAITLVESDAPAHAPLAAELMRGALPHAGKSLRIGITGTPGVGKSTFIDALGQRICARDVKLAVLAVDPSSPIAHGSILGDKTRMEALSRRENCFIRPSPSRCAAGGTASRTREAMWLCEAAGYGVIVVETVGVGQGEVAVRSMVDLFLLLTMPGTGDDLQAIKRGIVELADLIVVNKADGEFRAAAERARQQFELAMRAQHWADHDRAPRPVLVCSARTGDGLDDVWSMVSRLRDDAVATGGFAAHRHQQLTDWLDARAQDAWREWWQRDPAITRLRRQCEEEILAGRLDIETAVTRLAAQFLPQAANLRAVSSNPAVVNAPAKAYAPAP